MSRRTLLYTLAGALLPFAVGILFVAFVPNGMSTEATLRLMFTKIGQDIAAQPWRLVPMLAWMGGFAALGGFFSRLAPFLEKRRRRGLGLCTACGYDLRGSPPRGACPECGAARPAIAAERT